MRVRQTPKYRAAMKRLILKRSKRREDKEKLKVAMLLEVENNASEDTTVKGRRVSGVDARGSEGETYLLQEGKEAEEVVERDRARVQAEEEVKEGYDWVDGYFRKKREKKVCEHGKGLTDYCLSCGRVNGGG